MEKWNWCGRFAASLMLVWLTPLATATEPLYDQLTIDTQKGHLFPEKCCWVDLPDSEQLRRARIAERCSAIGGPVGQFKLENGKIWITGFYKCGGELPLKTFFPNLPDPALAEWLSGKFVAQIDYLCRSQTGSPVYRREINLVVGRGVVQSRAEKINDEASCAWRHEHPPQPTRVRDADPVG
jgi:hypothetical protein